MEGDRDGLSFHGLAFPSRKFLGPVALFELTCSPNSRDKPLGHFARGGTMFDFDPTLTVVFIAAACGMGIALFALIYPEKD